MRMKRKQIVISLQELNKMPPSETAAAAAQFIGKPLTYLMRFSFPVSTLIAVFVSFYGPLCKPGSKYM